jgi:hypothetical protein
MHLPDPGSYQVAVARPARGSHGTAPQRMGPSPGHRYIVAFRGQVANHSLGPFVLDEPKVATDLGATPSDAVTIAAGV